MVEVSNVDGGMVTEKPPKQTIEQAESDVTITLPRNQPTTLFMKLNSLTSPDPLLVKVDPLGFLDREDALPTYAKETNRWTAAISASEIMKTEKSPLTDIEISRPTTGDTTASYQTEASSPDISTPGDQTALSWRQRLSPLGLSRLKTPLSFPHTGMIFGTDSLPVFCPGIRETNDVETGLNVAITQEALMNVGPAASNQRPIMTSIMKVVSSGLASSTPEIWPQASMTLGTPNVSNTLANAPSFTKAVSTAAYNPLALEWRPMEEKWDPDRLERSRIRQGQPQLSVTIPNTPGVRVLEPKENDRVLEWAKNVHPLHLWKGTVPRLTPKSSQMRISAATFGMCNEAAVHTPQGSKSDKTLTPRHNKITTPIDTTQPYQRPNLARRRAERQLAQSQIAPAYSTHHTTKLEAAPLHIVPVSGTSTAVTHLQAVASPSPPFTPPQAGQIYPASHTQSLTWKRLTNLGLEHCSLNPEVTKWTKAEQDLLRMGLIKRVPGKSDTGSFVVPKNFEQWLKFRAGCTEDALAENMAKIRNRNFEAEVAERIRQIHGFDDVHGFLSSSHGSTKRVKIEPAMAGKDYRDGRSTVLAHPSTWSPWYQPTEERPEALWPCMEEMKEEGDERHTSAFRRFPALPRVPGNPTVVWKVKPVIPALHFDRVWKVPTRDTWAELYSLKEPNPEEEYMEGLIGQSLLDAISL